MNYIYLSFTIILFVTFFYFIFRNKYLISKINKNNYFGLMVVITLAFIILFCFWIFDIIKNENDKNNDESACQLVRGKKVENYKNIRSYNLKKSNKVYKNNMDLRVLNYDARNVPKNIVFTYISKDKVPGGLLEKWKEINPSYNIIFYNDEDCEDYLEKNFSIDHKHNFTKIKNGPIKADYFRAHRMIEGGCYIDIDVVPFSLDEIEKYNKFIVPYSRNVNQLNPMIIYTEPNNNFILQTIKVYEELTKNWNKYSYWNWSIVQIMSSLNKINYLKIPKILEEKGKRNRRTIHSNNKKLLTYNHIDNYKNHKFQSKV